MLTPFCVKVFKQRWYVIGYCRERDAMRTFSLDRIVELHTTGTKFSVPADFEGAEYFNDSFGIITDNKQTETIRIKVFGMHVMYVRALPLHHSQKEIETAYGYSVFEYEIRPTLDLKQEIISRGNDMEVVYPESFRNEIKEMIEEMWNRYK